MDTKVKKKLSFGSIVNFFSTIISWTIFVLLLICAIFLVYYFISIKIYESKGSGYEPAVSLYTIITPSMTPNINVYDVVVDVKVENPEDIKVGDVITFYSDIPGVRNGTITHRVIAVNKDSEGNYKYRTKGDANLVDDGKDIEYSKIVGKVSIKIPQLGRIQFFVASKFGWLIVVLIPALYVIIKDIIKLLKLKDKNYKNKWARFLNRPVITFKKRKLLTYTPKEDEIKKESVNHVIFDDDEDMSLPTFKNDIVDSSLTKPLFSDSTESLKINNIVYEDENDDDMSLPSLKN